MVLDAPANFRSNLSGLLGSLAALSGLGFMLYRNYTSLRAARVLASGSQEKVDALVEDLDIFRLVSCRLKQLSPCLILIW